MMPAAKRQVVAHVCTAHEVSERRACQALGVERSDSGAVRLCIRELAQLRRRFGYRRLHFLLRREGLAMNQEPFRRLYREKGLRVRKRGGRRRAVGLRAPLALPSRPNQRWSLDFVSDTFTDGRRFRALAVVDDCTRECLALVADRSLSGARVARELAFYHQGKARGQRVVSWRPPRA
jgi:putative transposase